MSTKRQRIGYWKYTHGYVKETRTSKAELTADMIAFAFWAVVLIGVILFAVLGHF